MSEAIDQGRALVEQVALGYAADHGLRPESVTWEDQGYQWLLRVSDAERTVRVIFSPDELALFAGGSSEENRPTKLKIRNAFASLSM